MKITQIEYERVRNIGNYETERMKAIALVSDDEDPAEVFRTLENWVHHQLFD